MDLYAGIKKNEKIKEFFQKNNLELSDENIKKNIIALNRFLDDQAFDCSDLNKKCERVNYNKVDLLFQNNMIYSIVSKCEHFTKENPFELIRKNFIYENVNMKHFDGSLKKLEMEIKTRNDEYSKSINKIIRILFEIMNKEDGTKGIYIFGPVRAGKTYVLKAIAREYAKKQKKVIISTFQELCSTIRSSYEKEYDPSLINVEKCQKVDVLLLDDIGVGKFSRWNLDEVLFPILNYRLENGKITYFTSNFSLLDLKDRIKGISDEKDQEASKIMASRISGRISDLLNSTVELKGMWKI